MPSWKSVATSNSNLHRAIDRSLAVVSFDMEGRILEANNNFLADKQSAADAQGLAGLSDHTDYHWGGMLQAAALSTLLSVGAEAGSAQQDSDIVRALRAGAADSVSRSGQQVVERQLNIQPTLTIRPGFAVRVILTRDLVLEPYGD